MNGSNSSNTDGSISGRDPEAVRAHPEPPSSALLNLYPVFVKERAVCVEGLGKYICVGGQRVVLASRSNYTDRQVPAPGMQHGRAPFAPLKPGVMTDRDAAKSRESFCRVLNHAKVVGTIC
jgi:hypothetical protein